MMCIVRGHPTGLTVALFFGLAAALGLAPVPERYKPVRLDSLAELEAAGATRVVDDLSDPAPLLELLA